MNTSYCYENYEKWSDKGMKAAPAAIETLVQALGQLPEERGTVDENPLYSVDREEAKTRPEYHYKAGCLDMPVVIEKLQAKGLHYESLEMGATRWLVIMPQELLDSRDRKVPLLIVFHKEDYDDPCWAMKTLELYASYNNAAAEKKDRTILYLVSNQEPCRMFQGMITEGIQNYCGDRDRVYVDLSNLKKNGLALKDLQDFHYCDRNGETVTDPDAQIEELDGIPVLNFSWRWVTPWRPHPIGGANDGTIDLNWLYRSGEGEKLLRQNQFMMRFSSVKDPDVLTYWDQMGLNCGIHYVNEERWVIFTPKHPALEKLPVVVVFEEVNEPDDHAPIQAFGNYMTYAEIAAQGDCALIFFAMESPRLNDWLCEILADAGRQYPLDLSRVYLTGHSHNGHFVQEFARRHPELVACIAPLGNSPGLPTPEVSHEAVSVDDERAAKMETMDMPTCILCGCKEVGCMVPINEAGHAFEAGINVQGYAASAEGKTAMWQRRLKAERCPQQSTEEVMAAASSPNKAIRALGFPADRAETLWLDGFEHYIGDIRNIDGNYHFRVVAIENLSHMVAPSMNLCAWNYMRQFARDLKSGKVIELETGMI
ncbi:MAG: hypothetical protein LUF35_14350 [Lachnospiraceae bacterium]|nr:hypothetical protein [Lachnospiraceae bacterium]